MLTLNCDSANKMVKQLQADRDALLRREMETRTYSYLANETPEKSDYDFQSTQAKLNEYTQKIIRLKHAINQFNVSTMLLGINMTIDAALVNMAILSREKHKLDTMRTIRAKTRTTNIRGTSEYTVRAYSEEEAEAAYQNVCKQLILIQQAINTANLTQTFEVDI